jgi:hypothetical protein
LTAKTHRYRRLGVPLYVVTVDEDALDVVAHRDGPERWIGRPIPELGGLRIDANDESIVVVMPDGRVLHSAGDLVRHADRRVEVLEAQLRALGIEPTRSD